MRVWLFAAAAVSALTLIIHVVAGGRQIARPLLADQALSADVKYTLYLCWHLVTIVLSMMALGYVWAAMMFSREVAALLTAQAALFAAWNIGMVARHRFRVGEYPQWTLFLVICCFGCAGLWSL
jgi:hypothetical protein